MGVRIPPCGAAGVCNNPPANLLHCCCCAQTCAWNAAKVAPVRVKHLVIADAGLLGAGKHEHEVIGNAVHAVRTQCKLLYVANDLNPSFGPFSQVCCSGFFRLLAQDAAHLNCHPFSAIFSHFSPFFTWFYRTFFVIAGWWIMMMGNHWTSCTFKSEPKHTQLGSIDVQYLRRPSLTSALRWK